MQYYYIAGGMSKFDDHNYPTFNSQAAWLRSTYPQYIFVSPAEMDQLIAGLQTPKELAIQIDIQVISHPDCLGITLLPDWEDSVGTALELNLARFLGKEIRDSEFRLIELEHRWEKR